MKHRKLWLIAALLAALAIAGLIFFFSGQKAEESDMTSAGIVEPVLHAVCADYDEMPAEAQLSLRERVTFAVRKLAHFGLFALLGLCLAAHLWLRREGKPERSTALMAWGIAALYAASDEAHQALVDGRSPELRDVGIDAAGALCGVLLIWLLARLVARRGQKKRG